MTKWDERKTGVFNQDWAYVQQGTTLYHICREAGNLKVYLKRHPDVIDHDEVRQLAEEALSPDHPDYRTRVKAAGRNPDKE